MKKAGDNVDFTVFGSDAGAEKSGMARRKGAPSHMKAESRIALYLTMAGLLEGGFSIKEAAGLVANEYQAAEMRMEAFCARTFFEGVEVAAACPNPSAEMGILATRAFGRNFVGPEEMALLRALPIAREPSAVLRGAAAVVGLEYRDLAVQSPRAVRQG